MTSSSTGGFLASLTQPDRVGMLTQRVKNLPVAEFVCLLDFITAEFQQSLQAFDLVNNAALEQILSQILDALTFKVGQVLHAEHTTIFLVDSDKQQLWSTLPVEGETSANGNSGHGAQNGAAVNNAANAATPVQELRSPLNLGITGQAATTGTVQNINNVTEHSKFAPTIDALGGLRARNLLCMPVRSSGGEVVAVVQLLNKVEDQAGETDGAEVGAKNVSTQTISTQKNNQNDVNELAKEAIANALVEESGDDIPFTDDDEKRFQEFAASIGIILESCQSFHAVARNQRGVTALLEAMTCLSQTLDLNGTLRVVMKEARDLIQAEHGNFFLYDAEGDRLLRGQTSTPSPVHPSRTSEAIPRDRGLVSHVARTGETLNISNVALDERFDPEIDRCPTGPTRNVLCMPVFNPEGKLIGVSQLINRKQGSFSASDEAFLKAFNTQAGVALENARLFETVLLEQQYQRDILRSLSNAVISTDMDGNIVTINIAALKLLGCPVSEESDRVSAYEGIWRRHLVGRPVWDVLPLDKLQMRLEDSLSYGARSQIPEQRLNLLVARDTYGYPALANRRNDQILLWNDPRTPFVPPSQNDGSPPGTSAAGAEYIEHVNVTVNVAINPLTNPEGEVRGALVVLEDVSREKRLKATMYRYMNPGVADQAIALGEESLLAGERKDVTILFSDIRGYTTLTEDLGAAEVVSMLNSYFGTMVEAVFEYGGTLDKFIGDALMAVFGAPLPLDDDHAWMAVACALEMRSRLNKLNRHRQLLNQTPIHIGIGIGSGEVVVGNIGSSRRMDYTAIGDAVNVSARLESLTKEYACDMIVSESTYAHCRDRVWARDLDRVRVKGKTEFIRIYEILGLKSKRLSRTQQEFLERYHMGRRAYETHQFQQALVHFAAAQQLRPQDRGVALHIDRVTAALDCPPADFWDIYQLKDKNP
ncbi:MAG: adenylate/guanylate cyclase domain-containing protein [Cyanobacteria bacterium P01_D01_bin.73]